MLDRVLLSISPLPGPSATEFYPLSLHDALPISRARAAIHRLRRMDAWRPRARCWTVLRSAAGDCRRDRKSTRLNSSHLGISYAVFCLKKKINVVQLL